MTIGGALRFARFAVPPNERGFCGPAREGELAAYRAEELEVDAGLRHLASGFEGAWPYLELLAGAAGTDDPLDDRVVQAYWIGNELCGRVASNDWGRHIIDRFRPRAGGDVERLTSGVGLGAVPHHSFHVFCVYPWVGLLRDGLGGVEPLQMVLARRPFEGIGWEDGLAKGGLVGPRPSEREDMKDRPLRSDSKGHGLCKGPQLLQGIFFPLPGS